MSQPSFWGYLMSPVFDLPSTSDVAVGDVIYSANSQFFSLPSPADGEFDVTTFAGSFQLDGVIRTDFMPLIVATEPLDPTPGPTMGPTTRCWWWWRPAMTNFVAASCLHFHWM